MDKIEKMELKIKNQASNIKVMEDLVQEQKRQIRYMQESIEHKNKMLDTLHYVWCSGGCNGGVHRYDHMKNIELTEEIVDLAESYVKRLRAWFNNFKFKNK